MGDQGEAVDQFESKHPWFVSLFFESIKQEEFFLLNVYACLSFFVRKSFLSLIIGVYC